MSIYRYPQSSVIDEVTFRKSEGGQTRAYVHAADNAGSKILNDIICNLADRDWQVTPYSIGGKPLLEIHGFKSQEKLISLLEQQGWTQGQRQHIPMQEDKLSFSEQVRKRSLGASGVAYLVGDASFTKYGYADHNPLNFAAGILYGAGTVSLLVGGRKDQSDLQIRDISKRMAAHFRDIDIQLPKDCSLAAITEDHKRGVIKTADDLFRRYPSELMNMFFAAAGTCIAVAAYKSLHSHPDPVKFKNSLGEVFTRLKKTPSGSMLTEEKVANNMKYFHKLESILDIGLGAMTSLSGLFVLSVKEKARDPDDPPKHGLEAAWEFVREKPLAIAGAMLMASTMCHAVSTAIAWKWADNDRRKSVPWRAIFVGANLLAELLLAISSKGHGEGVKSDTHVDDTVVSLAAELIVKQPKAMQEYLINHLSGFLSRPDVLAMKNEEATKLLRTQVEAMRKNPWAVASNDVKNAIAPATKKSLPAWQTKVSTPSPEVTRPGLA